MYIPEVVLVFLSGYFAAGALFALAFLAIGMRRIDPQTRQAGIGFRLLIFPGASIFWPLLMKRWLRSGGPQ
jgi:hypothetical protein